MIDLIAAAGIGGIFGMGVMAAFTVSKVADAQSTDDECRMWEGAWLHATAAHTRCSDALETARNRIERALEQITPGANATVQRIGRILRGEQA